MNKAPKFSGWIASLSDGTTHFEQPPAEGQRSSWQRLLKMLRETDGLEMTMLRLQHNGITVMAMPQKMCDGYFQARELQKKFFRSMGQLQEKERHLQGVGSVVGDQIFISWIDLESGNVYQEIRPTISSEGWNSLIHTTRYEEPDGQRSRNKAEAG
jgi:hypothetical protein